MMDEPIFSDALGGQSVTLLVVRPHPDDESSATGVMIVTELPGSLHGLLVTVCPSRVAIHAFLAAGDAHSCPEAGTAWQLEKLYVILQIYDCVCEALRTEFAAARIKMPWLEQRPPD